MTSQRQPTDSSASEAAAALALQLQEIYSLRSEVGLQPLVLRSIHNPRAAKVGRLGSRILVAANPHDVGCRPLQPKQASEGRRKLHQVHVRSVDLICLVLRDSQVVRDRIIKDILHGLENYCTHVTDLFVYRRAVLIQHRAGLHGCIASTPVIGGQ